jgi:hypothetical protein
VDIPFPTNVSEAFTRVGNVKTQDEPSDDRTSRLIFSETGNSNSIDADSWRELFSFLVKYLNYRPQSV